MRNLVQAATLLLVFAFTSTIPVIASQSVTTYQVVNGSDGKQYYINRDLRAILLPGFGVSPGAGTVQIFRNDEGQRWYMGANGKQIAIRRAQKTIPVKRVAPAFEPLVDPIAPLGETVYWDDVGPFFWGPGHSLHRIDQNSDWFKQLQDWHNAGLWNYGRDRSPFVQSSEEPEGDAGHPSWNRHRRSVHAEQVHQH